jgi:hypothetical protein
VTASAEKKVLKLLRKKKTKSTGRALAAFNKERQPHQRRLEAKNTVRSIAQRHDWVFTSKLHDQAGQQEWDYLVCVSYAESMLRRQDELMMQLMMPDEKVFSLSETHGGGVWHPRNEEPPHVSQWQSKVQWHVWGGICWEGALPLHFLEGGTFLGKSTWLKRKRNKEAEKGRSLTAKETTDLGHSYNWIIDAALGPLETWTCSTLRMASWLRVVRGSRTARPVIGERNPGTHSTGSRQPVFPLRIIT